MTLTQNNQNLIVSVLCRVPHWAIKVSRDHLQVLDRMWEPAAAHRPHPSGVHWAMGIVPPAAAAKKSELVQCRRAFTGPMSGELKRSRMAEGKRAELAALNEQAQEFIDHIDDES